MKQRIRTPDSVARDVKAIRDELDGGSPDAWGRGVASLLDEYRWAYAAAHHPTVRERASTGASVADDGSVPGPTASVAADKEKMRKEVTSGVKKLSEALSLIRQARSHFSGALKGLTPDRYDDQARFPRTATDDDLAQAKEAKARRVAAGQGWGEG